MKSASHILMLVIAVTLLATPAASTAPEPETDPWAPIRHLLGTWEGTEIGKEDASRVTQEYSFTLGDRFIRSTTHAEFDPAEPDAETEIHEDVGYFSFDPDRQLIVFRQFHSEGFVNTYVLARATQDSLVFLPESSEGSGGTDVRLRYWLSGPGEFVQELDLAPPGASYFTYKQMRLVRSSN